MFKNFCKIPRLSIQHPVIDMLNNFLHIWPQRRCCFNTVCHEYSNLWSSNSAYLSTTFFGVWGLSDAHFTKKNTITVHVSLWGKIQRKIRLKNFQLVGAIVLFLPLFLLQCFCGQSRNLFPPRPFLIIITIVISCLFGKNKRAAEYHKRKERGCDSSVPELRPEMHSVRAC